MLDYGFSRQETFLIVWKVAKCLKQSNSLIEVIKMGRQAILQLLFCEIFPEKAGVVISKSSYMVLK